MIFRPCIKFVVFFEKPDHLFQVFLSLVRMKTHSCTFVGVGMVMVNVSTSKNLFFPSKCSLKPNAFVKQNKKYYINDDS